MIKATLLTLALGYLTVVLLLYVFQRNLMYLPGGDAGAPGDSAVPEMTVMTVRADDGVQTVSWYATAANGTGKTVVILHGNAGNIADRDFKARYFIDAGYGAMLVGYRGFGGNPGQPTESGLYADARAALSALESQGVAAGDIVLYGESMGSGIAVQMAKEMSESDTPAGGVILEAPFTSMAAAAAYHYAWIPARYLVRDRFDSIAKIAAINAPVLIVHGDSDRTVPQVLGKKLFSAAAEPKDAIWLEGAGHVDIFDFDVVSPMLTWLAELPDASS